MSNNNKLSKYRAKRDFSKTAEPSGQTKITASNRRRFILQKHAATHVGRAVEERDTCYFTTPEEPNSLNGDQVHFLQVQHDVRFALPNLLLQLG